MPRLRGSLKKNTTILTLQRSDAVATQSGATALGGTPNLTLSTSNAAGTDTTFVRTDATVALFDATNPVTLTPDLAANAGAVAYAARRDHAHGGRGKQRLDHPGGGRQRAHPPGRSRHRRSTDRAGIAHRR
jgi:hypothetical protein